MKLLKGKKGTLSSATLVLVLVVLCVALAIVKPVFLKPSNLFNVLRTTSITGLIAIGMTCVIITGGIDLSVGAVVGLSSVLCGILMKENGWPVLPALIVTIIVCVLVGLINGLLIHYGKIPAFIATLGTMQMSRGLAMLITQGRTIPGLPQEFTKFAQLKILSLPSLFVVWVLVILVASYILKYTRTGRNIYSIGSNLEASRLSGIKLAPTICFTYMFNALCAALAGILLTARITSAQPSAGEGYEMTAIAAAVIGGASLAGAEGTIIGTVLGACIMAVLQNGGNLLGINGFIMDIATGALVVIAVLIEKNKRK